MQPFRLFHDGKPTSLHAGDRLHLNYADAFGAGTGSILRQGTQLHVGEPGRIASLLVVVTSENAQIALQFTAAMCGLDVEQIAQNVFEFRECKT